MVTTEIPFRENHPFLFQYAKYSISGFLSTVVKAVTFFLAAWILFPALEGDDIVVRTLGLQVEAVNDLVRARNSMASNVIAFFVCNAVAYTLNRTWVFEPGRHHVMVEVFLFYAVSAGGMIAGTASLGSTIALLGVATSTAWLIAFVISSVMNFALRKFFIFKR